jgi:hypothetical protein
LPGAVGLRRRPRGVLGWRDNVNIIRRIVKIHGCVARQQVEAVSLREPLGGFLFAFGGFSIEMRRAVKAPVVSARMPRFAIPKGETRQQIGNATIQDIAHEGTVAAITTLTDKNQMIALRKQKSHISIVIVNGALRGRLDPAIETPLAGAYLLIVGDNDKIIAQPPSPRRFAQVVDEEIHDAPCRLSPSGIFAEGAIFSASLHDGFHAETPPCHIHGTRVL